MGLDKNSRSRLLREDWRTPTMLAQELYAMFESGTDDEPDDGVQPVELPPKPDQLANAKSKPAREDALPMNPGRPRKPPTPGPGQSQSGGRGPKGKAGEDRLVTTDWKRRLSTTNWERPRKPPRPQPEQSRAKPEGAKSRPVDNTPAPYESTARPAPAIPAVAGAAGGVPVVAPPKKPRPDAGLPAFQQRPAPDALPVRKRPNLSPDVGFLDTGSGNYVGQVESGKGTTWQVTLYPAISKDNPPQPVLVLNIDPNEPAPVGMYIAPVLSFKGTYIYQPALWMGDPDDDDAE